MSELATKLREQMANGTLGRSGFKSGVVGHVCSLWTNKYTRQDNGKEDIYLSGTFGPLRFSLFVNDRRGENSKAPHWRSQLSQTLTEEMRANGITPGSTPFVGLWEQPTLGENPVTYLSSIIRQPTTTQPGVILEIFPVKPASENAPDWEGRFRQIPPKTAANGTAPAANAAPATSPMADAPEGTPPSPDQTNVPTAGTGIGPNSGDDEIPF